MIIETKNDIMANKHTFYNLFLLFFSFQIVDMFSHVIGTNAYFAAFFFSLEKILRGVYDFFLFEKYIKIVKLRYL